MNARGGIKTRRIPWTDGEIAIVEAGILAGATCGELQRLLPNRTISAVKAQMETRRHRPDRSRDKRNSDPSPIEIIGDKAKHERHLAEMAAGSLALLKAIRAYCRKHHPNSDLARLTI